MATAAAERVYVALGSNLGDRAGHLAAARAALEPRALLEACHAIEQAEGRVRQERWGARTLDVDIVRFGGRHVAEPDLIIPHPELANRDFWQRELAELHAHDR